MSGEFNLPETTEYPDWVNFETRAIGWEFESGGNKASRDFIQPGFEEVLPVAAGGEQITLKDPTQGTYLSIAELNDAGEVQGQPHVLTEDNEQVFIPGGGNMRLTTVSKIVELVRVYPGKPAGGASAGPASPDRLTADETLRDAGNKNLATVVQELIETGSGNVNITQVVQALYGTKKISPDDFASVRQEMQGLVRSGAIVRVKHSTYTAAGGVDDTESPSADVQQASVDPSPPTSAQGRHENLNIMMNEAFHGRTREFGKPKYRNRRKATGK